jgi:hypothetical protein
MTALQLAEDYRIFTMLMFTVTIFTILFIIYLYKDIYIHTHT